MGHPEQCATASRAAPRVPSLWRGGLGASALRGHSTGALAAVNVSSASHLLAARRSRAGWLPGPCDGRRGLRSRPRRWPGGLLPTPSCPVSNLLLQRIYILGVLTRADCLIALPRERRRSHPCRWPAGGGQLPARCPRRTGVLPGLSAALVQLIKPQSGQGDRARNRSLSIIIVGHQPTTQA